MKKVQVRFRGMNVIFCILREKSIQFECVQKNWTKKTQTITRCRFLKKTIDHSVHQRWSASKVAAYTLCECAMNCRLLANNISIPICQYGFTFLCALQWNSFGRLVLFLLSKLIWRWQFVLRYGKHDVKIRLYLKIDTSVEILYALWIWIDIQTHTCARQFTQLIMQTN